MAFKLPFLHEGSTFSMRKFLAFGSGLIFFIACIWNLIRTGDLTATQYGITSGVFAFYFTKNLFEGLKVTKK